MDIEIRPELKELFKKGYFQKAIQDYDIDKVYKLLSYEYRYNKPVSTNSVFESLLRTCTYQLTYILRSINIEPEKYLTRVPGYFYYSETFDVLDLTDTHIEQFDTGAINGCSIGTLRLPKTIKNISRWDFLNSAIDHIVLDMSLDDVKELLQRGTFGPNYPNTLIFGNDSKDPIHYSLTEKTWVEAPVIVKVSK